MLKIKKYLLIILSSFFLFSCTESTSSVGKINENEIAEIAISDDTKDAITYDFLITNGMTFLEINTILNSALSGDRVAVEAGTYNITGELAIKDGISIYGKSEIRPVFTAIESSSTEMLEQYWSSNNSDIEIYGIEFKNIRLNLRYASNTTIKSCVFDYGKRKLGTNKSFTQDAYIQLFETNNILLSENTFKRRQGNSGRGVYIVDCENTEILNNTFGNDNGDEGYFVCSINDNSNGTVIKENIIKRNESWVNLNETDHGIYVHSFNNVTIENNTISGWPTNSSGGSIKLRNGENATIRNNTMSTSGILMYVYGNTPDHPILKNVVIINNNINVAITTTDDIYHGIGYWRDTLEEEFYEESINITENVLPNGNIKISNPINVASFNKNGGGVFKNDIKVISLVSGINNSGND